MSRISVLREREPLDIVESGGSAWAIAWPRTGSQFRAMHRIELGAGGRTVPLRHPGEAVYFVVAGTGAVGDRPLRPRSVVYVPPGTEYRLSAEEPLVVVGGPCPPDPALYGGEAAAAAGGGDGTVQVYDAETDGVPVPVIGRHVRLIVGPGTGADIATMNYAPLDPGEENQPHAHAESEDTIAILEGKGSIDDLDAGVTHEFEAGDVLFVPPGVPHKVKADRGVAVVSAGGPCPPDYAMMAKLGLLD
jgi:quercetin dioxygenase-like cupin family protein